MQHKPPESSLTSLETLTRISALQEAGRGHDTVQQEHRYVCGDLESVTMIMLILLPSRTQTSKGKPCKEILGVFSVPLEIQQALLGGIWRLTPRPSRGKGGRGGNRIPATLGSYRNGNDFPTNYYAVPDPCNRQALNSAVCIPLYKWRPQLFVGQLHVSTCLHASRLLGLHESHHCQLRFYWRVGIDTSSGQEGMESEPNHLFESIVNPCCQVKDQIGNRGRTLRCHDGNL